MKAFISNLKIEDEMSSA